MMREMDYIWAKESVQTYILEDDAGAILYNGPIADKMYKKMLEKEGRYKSYSFTKIDEKDYSAELTEWDVFKDESVNRILEMDTATLHLCRREVVEGLEEILKRSSGGVK